MSQKNLDSLKAGVDLAQGFPVESIGRKDDKENDWVIGCWCDIGAHSICPASEFTDSDGVYRLEQCMCECHREGV